MEIVMNNKELQQIANEVRKGIVTAVHSAKSGHPGGSVSVPYFVFFKSSANLAMGKLKIQIIQIILLSPYFHQR